MHTVKKHHWNIKHISNSFNYSHVELVHEISPKTLSHIETEEEDKTKCVCNVFVCLCVCVREIEWNSNEINWRTIPANIEVLNRSVFQYLTLLSGVFPKWVHIKYQCTVVHTIVLDHWLLLWFFSLFLSLFCSRCSSRVFRQLNIEIETRQISCSTYTHCPYAIVYYKYLNSRIIFFCVALVDIFDSKRTIFFFFGMPLTWLKNKNWVKGAREVDRDTYNFTYIEIKYTLGRLRLNGERSNES